MYLENVFKMILVLRIFIFFFYKNTVFLHIFYENIYMPLQRAYFRFYEVIQKSWKTTKIQYLNKTYFWIAF